MDTNLLSVPTHDDVCSFISAARSDPDPRTQPAASLILAGFVSPAQEAQMLWPDVKLASYAVLIRDPKGKPSRIVELTPLLVRQLLPLAQQGPRPSRPFGKPWSAAPTIAQLLTSVLGRAGLGRFTPEDFVTWSKAQTEATRKSVVTS